MAQVKADLNVLTGNDDYYYTILAQQGISKANEVKANDREKQKEVYYSLKLKLKSLREVPPQQEEEIDMIHSSDCDACEKRDGCPHIEGVI